MIGVIDTGLGNIRSVLNAVAVTGGQATLCGTPDQVEICDRLIFPGVGTLAACMTRLRDAGLDEALNEAVIRRGRPFLGICLGMQAMATRGSEGGEIRGLGWLDAESDRIAPAPSSARVPHVGWNDIEFNQWCPLFRGVPQLSDVYFVHSYALRCANPDDVSAWSDHGGKFPAAVWRDNMMGTQFHPEKSQDVGLSMLENFIAWSPG